MNDNGGKIVIVAGREVRMGNKAAGSNGPLRNLYKLVDELPVVKAAIEEADAENSHDKLANRMMHICRHAPYSGSHYWMFTAFAAVLSTLAAVGLTVKVFIA